MEQGDGVHGEGARVVGIDGEAASYDQYYRRPVPEGVRPTVHARERPAQERLHAEHAQPELGAVLCVDAQAP